MHVIYAVTMALIAGFVFGILFMSVINDPDLFKYDEEEDELWNE